MRSFICVCFGFILVTMIVCAIVSLGPQVVTEKNKDAILIVRPNEEFLVQLDSQPNTGYTWEFIDDNDDLDEEDFGVHLIRSDYVSKTTNTELTVGNDCYQLFRMRTLKVGFYKLNFKYVRPFDRESGPKKTFEFVVDSVPK